MAIYLEATYSKKLGLPGYSSHQYSLALKTETGDLAQVSAESSRLYSLLQLGVDREIQKTGSLPIHSRIGGEPIAPANVLNGHSHGNGNASVQWMCSKSQRARILKIIQQHGLNESQVEALARGKFDQPLSSLNKIQASWLIHELYLQVESNRRWLPVVGITTPKTQ